MPWALRQAIARRYQALGPNDILVCAGASEALAAIAHALVQRGDEVALGSDAYPSFVAAARRCGARIVTVPTGATRAWLMTNPSAPDGQWRNIQVAAEQARRIGAVLIVDEVYRELSERPEPAAADTDADAISIGDISKPLGLGGLRIGWVATRNTEFRERIARELELLSGGPSTLSAAAATEAVFGMDGYVSAVLSERAGRAGPVLRLLEEYGWRAEAPAAGITIAAGAPVAVTQGRMAALRDAGLFAVPGALLGWPGTVRLSLLAPLDDIERGLRIFASV